MKKLSLLFVFLTSSLLYAGTDALIELSKTDGTAKVGGIPNKVPVTDDRGFLDESFFTGSITGSVETVVARIVTNVVNDTALTKKPPFPEEIQTTAKWATTNGVTGILFSKSETTSEDFEYFPE